MISLINPAPGQAWLRTALAWAATLVWAALIFGLSTQTFGSSFSAWLLDQFFRLLHIRLSPVMFTRLNFLIRKLAHLTEYAIFSLLLYRSLEGNLPHRWRARTALWAIVIAGLYSLTDEYHQRFVHGRTASPIDCGIDTLGAALGMLGLYGNGRLFHAWDSRSAAVSDTAAEKKKGAAGE